jgi:hypothetical protein
MPAGKRVRDLVTGPVTRYRVPLVPVVLAVVVVVWLVGTAFVDGQWLAGAAALAVVAAWSLAWIVLRRNRLRRAMVLPPSPRAERREARRNPGGPERGDGAPKP